jgi:hypothetical protein
VASVDRDTLKQRVIDNWDGALDETKLTNELLDDAIKYAFAHPVGDVWAELICYYDTAEDYVTEKIGVE